VNGKEIVKIVILKIIIMFLVFFLRMYVNFI